MKHKYLRTPILLIGTLSMYSAIPTAYATDINCTTVTQISIVQCNALAAFYTSTDGDNWTNTKTNKDNWGNISQICPITSTSTDGTSVTTTPGWHGVRCQSGNVVSLSLPNNNLNGKLPDLISDLTGLQTLKLNKNGLLTGPLPNLASLTKLETLDVSNDGLSGPLPATLSNLTKLETLFVNDNKFTGSLPDLKALQGLKTVNCNNNQLTGAIPALNTLTTLQTFTCSGNQLSGAIPALDKLTFLGTFDVSGNASGKPLLCKDATEGYYGNNAAKLAGLEDCVTTITGTVFNDMNGNGKKDPNDNGRVGETITLTNIDPTVTPTPISINQMDTQGKYQKDVPPGTYTVALTVPNDGSKITTPLPEVSTITLELGQTTELNFGLQPSSKIEINFVTLTSSDPIFLGVGEVTLEAEGFETQSCLKNDCTRYYPANTKVTLTAKIDGYLFGGWGGDCEQSTTDSAESNAGTSKTVTITTADANTPKNCKVKFQRFACNLAGISISESQCYALQLLYEKNNGPLWNNRPNNWLETLNPCNWKGVTCDPLDGKPLSTENKAVVTRLDLSNNNLAYGLGETDLKPLMSTLTHLDLSNNPNLKGALPEWIGTPGPIQDKGNSAIITNGSGLCKRLALDYGSLYYTMTLPNCPPPAPDAVFTMSPSPDPQATATVTPSETTEATTPDTSGTPSTSSTTTSSGTTDSSTSAATTDGYTGYTVLFDATRSKPSTLNGLILTYEWSVSDTNNTKYYLEAIDNQATNEVSPALGQPIKPIAYKVTTTGTKQIVTTDTPKLTVTFPKPTGGTTPPDGQTSINYTLSLVVTEDKLDSQGKPMLPPNEGPSPTKSSANEQLVPLPLSTLIISKTGDGSGTIVATQVVKTEPAMIPATCCFDYPSAFYNATVDSAVELIADVPEGSYFKGWLGDGCNLPDTTNGTTGTDNTTTTIDPETGSQTVRLIIDNMSLGAAKTCTADFRVIMPDDPLHPLPSDMHLLTVKTTLGAGHGLVEAPDGTISCGDDNKPDCKENYKEGYHLRLRAIPGLNSNFAIWSSPEHKETAGCTGQKKAVITIVTPVVSPAVPTDIECDANFESDSNLGGVIETDKCYGGSCEMDTPEPIDKWFPQHFVNEARMREALSFVGPVEQLLEKQLDLTDQTTLANTWPDQLNDKDFYKKKPVGEWTESVQIRHNAVVAGFLSSGTVEGYYIEVRVKLLQPDGTEVVVPILITYGDQPQSSVRRGLKGFLPIKIGWVKI